MCDILPSSYAYIQTDCVKEKELNLEPLSLDDLSQDAGHLYILDVYVITRPHGKASYAIKH